jgi:hypothetical protein
MTFARLDQQIELCRKHLDSTASRHTQVETCLVGFLLVRCCAEFEMCLVKICESRALKSGDSHLVNIARKWASTAKSRMKISDLTGHVATFGEDCRDTFRKWLDDPGNAKAKAAWDSIHADRTAVAHILAGSTTLADFESFFADSKRVLEAVGGALHLTPAEIAALTWP